jgi:hypothetical protein
LLFVAFFAKTFQVLTQKAPQSIKKSIKIKAKENSLTGSKSNYPAASICSGIVAFGLICVSTMIILGLSI